MDAKTNVAVNETSDKTVKAENMTEIMIWAVEMVTLPVSCSRKIDLLVRERVSTIKEGDGSRNSILP